MGGPPTLPGSSLARTTLARPSRRYRFFGVALVTVALVTVSLVTVLGASAAPVRGKKADESIGESSVRDTPELAQLERRHRMFLEEVAALITEVERDVFLSLGADYQRDHFIRRFWRVRDPFPSSGRNELREAWDERVVLAREQYDDLGVERAQALLALGVPGRVLHATCGDLLRPLEIWRYPEGVAGAARPVSLVFVGRQPLGHGPHRLWHPSDGLRALVALGALTGTLDDGVIAGAIDEHCPRGGLVVAGLVEALAIDGIADLVPSPPSDEWALALRDRSTDLDPDAELLDARFDVSFPGRYQSRTVVQAVARVPRAAAEPAVRGAYRAYGFVVDGEVLTKGELFERFRYRFDLPEAGLAPDVEELPLVIQRNLRPGQYTLIVKVQDLVSDRVFRIARELDVPRVAAETASDPESAPVAELGEPIDDAWLGSRLREANAALDAGDHALELVPPPRTLVVGKLRVAARVRGENIARVSFALDGRPILAKSRPPYSVELDLGPAPRPHVVRAEALAADGSLLASDEIPINLGPHRFGVRLVEPHSGRRYRESVRVRAAVEVPEGERLDRVEIFLGDERVATLYQPPFEQPVLLDGSPELSWVRAAAYLGNGAMAEDTVFINAPDLQEEIDVDLVELFTTVVDKRNVFAEGLAIDDFEVKEDGKVQQIRRFERVSDLPMHATLVLDTSLSMVEELRDVEKAAYRFLDEVMRDRDRAAVVTFADAPTLQVRFTNDRAILAGGLANLKAEGETALFDSLIFGLHYMSGLTGKRAIIVLTDGEDSKSRYGFDDVETFARHADVSIYVIALDLPSGADETRMQLRRLANESGGGFFTIGRVAQLESVYASIEDEVRSQYLLAYQSTSDHDGFRRVEVKVGRKGLKAKTAAGYFP